MQNEGKQLIKNMLFRYLYPCLDQLELDSLMNIDLFILYHSSLESYHYAVINLSKCMLVSFYVI